MAKRNPEGKSEIVFGHFSIVYCKNYNIDTASDR
jgi:hypothetical protein